jgi:integrase
MGSLGLTDVSERLGHANPSITLNVYSHVLPGRGAEVAQRCADLLLGTTPPAT